MEGELATMEDSSFFDDAALLGPEFLTPRSKIAKMLADIDNAPTPSPSNRLASGKDTAPVPQSISPRVPHAASDDSLDSLPSINEDHQLLAESDSEDSEDGIRPKGRAARRMRNTQKGAPTRVSSPVNAKSRLQEPVNNVEDDDDDLYSATPMKRPARVRTNSPSPQGTEQGNDLFVSPTKSTGEESDEELPSNPFGSKQKLADLVAQKRAERLARESEEKERRKVVSANNTSDLPDEVCEDPQEPEDPAIEKIMSDATRPSRKASKRALLEMERETQRLARQQALAHQMKVKRKFTTIDLFAKFNFRQPAAPADGSNGDSTEGNTTASSAPNSDGAEKRPKDPASTPPSSPPTPLDRQQQLVDQGALSKLMPVREDTLTSMLDSDDDDEVLPDLAEVLKSSQRPKHALVPPQTDDQAEGKGPKPARLGKEAIRQDDSSDEELDIIPSLPAHLRAFDKATGATRNGKPADSRAIHNLKHLAHIHADDGLRTKKGSRPSINRNALEMQLRRQAKEQARQQQLERIEELKAKGIEVQTIEEREKEAEAFENLLEKARQDAVDLRKAEKAARKQENGEDAMDVSDDEDEDLDYEDDDSGSEGEGDNEEEREENGILDEAAEEGSDEDSEHSEEEHEEEETAEDDVDEAEPAPAETKNDGKILATPAPGPRKSRKSRIIMDEDDEEASPDEAVVPLADVDEPADDPFAAFNFGAVDKANSLFSPTQAFNATMQTPTQASQDDSFDILRRIAPPSAMSLPPSLPDFDTQSQEDEHSNIVAGSQVPESQRINLNWETQPPETPVPVGLNRDVSALSETPGWEPTQDPGMPSPWGVKSRRESTAGSVVDQDTQSTVRLRISESPAASQIVRPRGRLTRRQAVASDDSEDEIDNPPALVPAEKQDAFREMARRRKAALTAAERADADKEMRGMMDEQAEESDDEYAGLGGDDFVAAETEEDREMIDSSHVEVDERALAAHFAERERIRNEEETSRLYKDLTTGVLRRKMGASAFDLEEDEDEMAARRRQIRQQEEARKRKALLKDVNVATLAEGRQSKGKDAFLKAIADDGGDEDIINLSDGEGESASAFQGDSQMSQSQQPVAEPLRETSGNKRRASEIEDAEGKGVLKSRRTQASPFRRPTSLLEVKESVSFLLDEPNAGAMFGPTVLETNSDSENGGINEEGDQADDSGDDDVLAMEEARQNDGGFAPNPVSMDAKTMPPPRLPASQRRTTPKQSVVDRLSLKRVSSAGDSDLGRTAWSAGPLTGGFKVPSLLRRATTNVASGANERGVTTPSLSRENSSGVKMGGTKKSSLAYQARAEERKAIVEASAKRREENTARIAQLRRNSSALNRGLTGRFE